VKAERCGVSASFRPMRAALERAGAGAEPRAVVRGSETLAARLVAGSYLALLAACVFAGDASGDDSLLWVGGAALVLALGTLTAGLAGAVALPRLSGSTLWCLVLATALVAWLGVSIAWSVEPDRSWSYFDRGVVYLALLGVGILAGGLVRRAATVAAAELALVVGLALAVGLAVKVFPSLYPDSERIARLRAPVGYWNALALLFAFGLPLALWLAGLAGRRTGLRALAVVFAYLLGVALALTFSRGGILAALAAVVVALALSRDRVHRLVDLAVAGSGATLVSAWALAQPGLAADGLPLSVRATDGHRLALALVLGALAVAGLTVALSRLRLADRLPRFSRRWAIGAALLAAVLLTVAVAASDPGARIDEFRNPPAVDVSQEGSRLTSLSSNHRWTWWTEAWKLFTDHPLLGMGAGSFGVAHKQVRVSDLDAVEPHSLPLQFLAETGLVGGLLAGGATLAALIAAIGAVRRAELRERAAVVALTCALGAYLAQGLVDFDWDFLAVTGPLMLVTGVLLATGRAPAPAPRRHGLWALAPPLALAALLYSFAAPWLAERRVETAYGAVADGKPASALASAESARGLNPLSVEPLRAEANARVLAGDVAGAGIALAEAVGVQPDNPETWYELGAFELQIAKRPEVAIEPLVRAAELDPHGDAPRLLAEARRARR
jgi:hypothetical protein